MKQQLRIKICKESSNAKSLRHITKDMDDDKAFAVKQQQKELDKKIMFLKGIEKELLKKNER